MARLARLIIEGGCFYVHSHSFRGETIFKDRRDYARYIELLKINKARYNSSLYAYCLLPAETHMVLHPREASDLPLFMHDINLAYAICYNKRRRRKGRVWGQRYKSQWMRSDKELVSCIRMIEFTPVRNNKAMIPVRYLWSSCAQRVNGNNSGIVDTMPPDGRERKNKKVF